MSDLAEKFAKHTTVKHECVCGRVIKGNGFSNHKRWCEKEMAIWKKILSESKGGFTPRTERTIIEPAYFESGESAGGKGE